MEPGKKNRPLYAHVYTEEELMEEHPEDRLKFSDLLKAEGRLTLPVEESGEEWAVKLPVSNQEAMERALARGVVARKELEVEEGGSYSEEDVSKLLNITPQTVDRRRKARRMIAWKDESGNWRFPVWQFSANGELPGVETCLKELDLGEDGWGFMIFFLSPSYTLEGKRPLDLLREGNLSRRLRRLGVTADKGPGKMWDWDAPMPEVVTTDDLVAALEELGPTLGCRPLVRGQ